MRQRNREGQRVRERQADTKRERQRDRLAWIQLSYCVSILLFCALHNLQLICPSVLVHLKHCCLRERHIQ